MDSGQNNGQKNEALAAAVEEWEATGKHRADLVRGITTERTLERWIKREYKRPNPFTAPKVAKRLGRSYEELFGSREESNHA